MLIISTIIFFMEAGFLLNFAKSYQKQRNGSVFRIVKCLQ